MHSSRFGIFLSTENYLSVSKLNSVTFELSVHMCAHMVIYLDVPVKNDMIVLCVSLFHRTFNPQLYFLL